MRVFRYIWLLYLKKKLYRFSTGFVFGLFSCYTKKGQNISTILPVLD